MQPIIVANLDVNFHCSIYSEMGCSITPKYPAIQDVRIIDNSKYKGIKDLKDHLTELADVKIEEINMYSDIITPDEFLKKYPLIEKELIEKLEIALKNNRKKSFIKHYKLNDFSMDYNNYIFGFITESYWFTYATI